jgi:hypothetical protein
MYYLYYFLFLLLLFLPTFIANAVPVIIKNIPIIAEFNTPINENIFWKNKTYRWFIFWVLFAVIVSIIQFNFISHIWLEQVIEEYYSIVVNIKIAILIWFIQWFWALLWDLIESYFKRKIWKKPWEAWIFWDWADYIIASIILFSFIYIPSIVWIIFLILFAPIISLLSNIIAYFIWWKNVWY